MNQEESRQLLQDVAEIKIAVIGNEKIGATGLVKRVERLEKKDRRRELRMATYSGVFIGMIEGIKSWFSSHSHH